MKAVLPFLGLVTAALAAVIPSGDPTPTARVLNGTYVGTRNEEYNQDFFLGMPYAQQPVGDLRFSVPQPLNESWEGERNATEYSDICVGYGVCSVFLGIKLFTNRVSNRRTQFGTLCLRPALP